MVDHRSYAHNLSSCEIKAWKKKSRHDRIRTHDICTFDGYITNSQSGQLPDGLTAQLVEHCTNIAEVMGMNLVQAWNFPGFNFATD